MLFFFFHMNQLGYPTYDPNFNMFLFWAGGLRPLLSFSLFVCVCVRSVLVVCVCLRALTRGLLRACMCMYSGVQVCMIEWNQYLSHLFSPFLIGKKNMHIYIFIVHVFKPLKLNYAMTYCGEVRISNNGAKLKTKLKTMLIKQLTT